jgi:hypothetical protein
MFMTGLSCHCHRLVTMNSAQSMPTPSPIIMAANVAVAEPTAAGRVIAAWPSFALIGSYELLMRQVRRSADSTRAKKPTARHGSVVSNVSSASARSSVPERCPDVPGGAVLGTGTGWELQLQAWQWAQANRASDGSLPSGKAIAWRHGRQERWGRLVKQAGLAGTYATDGQAA